MSKAMRTAKFVGKEIGAAIGKKACWTDKKKPARRDECEFQQINIHPDDQPKSKFEKIFGFKPWI